MMQKELLSLLNYWEKEKGINKKYLVEALEQGLLSVYRKKANLPHNVAIVIDDQTGTIRFLDEEQNEVEPPSFEWQRLAAQTARQIILQKLREAEKNTVYEEFQQLHGEIISGKVERFEDNNIIVAIGKVEALLPEHQKIDTERFRAGNPLKAYILEVRQPNRGAYQIILSRTHTGFVVKLLENEIPELKDGTVNIKAIARFPGDITKVAVSTVNPKIDPVGTCIGDKAIRIKNIMRELNGEKIEILEWDEDISKYIKNSLCPAKCKLVKLNEEKKQAIAVIIDTEIFLAIGKRGQNVRLASKLTGWDIRVLRESEYLEKDLPVISILKSINEETKQALSKAGYNSLKSIAEADIDKLLEKIPSVGREEIEHSIQEATKIMKDPKTKVANESLPDSKEI